ncbi:MAG: glycosyltransferase family 2 protein [Candidatus Hydrogenedentes bacterium]|nr:glycosyltransferase family 2 protein [Candidatus Hydrogenedentota bacterium]
MSTTSTPEFSVIITCYFEEKSIDEFYGKLSAALEGLNRSYEIIFVNDGSTDGTFSRLQAIFDRDPKVAAILDLFKNSGQAAAMTAGFLQARGDKFVFIDSDLQLDPGELPLLVAKYDAGFDIVSGCRTDRRDSLGRVLPSKIANMIMRRVSRSEFTDFGCTFKIFDARLILAFEYGPFKPWQPAYVIAQCQRCAEVPITHFPRKYGKSGWTFRKLFDYNMENLVGITTRPFQYLGTACFVLAALFVVRILLGWFLPFSVLAETTNGLILNAVIFGLLLTLAVLCLVGEFIVRNHNMLQRRPAYIVRTCLRKESL